MQIDLDTLFAGFSQLKVAVIGDVMLDTYWWGNVERVSPEAPVPIVSVNRKEKRIGGAGNVALNTEQLGTKTSLLTVLGDDDDGRELTELLESGNIDTSFILKSPARVTTNKIRIISRNQQMLRLDAEITSDLAEAEEARLVESIKQYIDSQHPDVIIFEDYNKGVLTKNVIVSTIAHCKGRNIITTVDPKRKNFFAYENVTLFKPNLLEAITALNRLPQDPSVELLGDIHVQIQSKLSHTVSLITLSENGVFFQQGDQKSIIPSHRREITDVSGAGDTVIAVASLVYAATESVRLAAEVANIAGGIVCEEVGTVSIDKQKLLAECKRLLT